MAAINQLFFLTAIFSPGVKKMLYFFDIILLKLRFDGEENQIGGRRPKMNYLHNLLNFSY